MTDDSITTNSPEEITLEWEESTFHLWEGQATRNGLDKFFVHFDNFNGYGIILRKNGLIFAMAFDDKEAEHLVMQEMLYPTMPSRNEDANLVYKEKAKFIRLSRIARPAHRNR